MPIKFNFEKINGEWLLTVTTDSSVAKPINLRNVVQDDIILLANLLAKGDIAEVNVNFTNQRV